MFTEKTKAQALISSVNSTSYCHKVIQKDPFLEVAVFFSQESRLWSDSKSLNLWAQHFQDEGQKL